MTEAPKRRRLRGDLAATMKLLPYVRPYLVGVIALIVVTLLYSAANAGRASLVMPLFNSILMRGGASVNNYKDSRLSGEGEDKYVKALDLEKADVFGPYRGADKAWVEAEAAKIIADPELTLPVVVLRGAPKEIQDDPLVQLLARTRAVLLEAAEKAAKPEALEKSRERIIKSVWEQRRAYDLVGKDPTKAPESKRLLAAAVSMDARRRASDVLFGELWDNLLWIFFAALGIAITLGATHFATFYLARALVTRMIVDVQNQLADHLLKLSIRYFNDKKRGDIFSRLTNDLQNLQAVLMLMLSDVLVQPIQIVVLASAAAWVSWPLSLSLGGLALTVFVPVRMLGKKIRRSARSRQHSVANVFEAMQQMFAGIRIVKAFRREPYEMERFRARTDEYLEASLRVVRDRTASKSIMELVNDITIPIVLLVGGILIIKQIGGLDVGRFGTFVGLVVLMYVPAKTLAASYNTLQDALPSVDRVFEILESKAEIQDAPDAIALPPVKEAVRFEDVTFGYDSEVPVLKNVSFTAKAGEVCAIAGHTGAGKSTLVDLIARFYDPIQGRVTVDGHDLKKVKLATLLDKVAVVTQDPFVFNDSIRENIRYGRLEATDAEVEAAARSAQIHDDIAAMPQGYQTNVGERGAKLSGGQRQRLTIARAILKNPEILILDEATSSLDATTERKVQEALDELEKGRTTFVIAHRLSTVQHAHKILVLEDGRLVEEGRHDELVAKGGIYTSFVKRLAMNNGAANGSAHVETTAAATSSPEPERTRG